MWPKCKCGASSLPRRRTWQRSVVNTSPQISKFPKIGDPKLSNVFGGFYRFLLGKPIILFFFLGGFPYVLGNTEPLSAARVVSVCHGKPTERRWRPPRGRSNHFYLINHMETAINDGNIHGNIHVISTHWLQCDDSACCCSSFSVHVLSCTFRFFVLGIL